jgi:hypothetical protein
LWEHRTRFFDRVEGVLTEAMARALMPLDELPQATDRVVFDGKAGLGLRVLPSGYKVWVWQGRTPHGRMVHLGLGEWGRRGLNIRWTSAYPLNTPK